MTAALCESNWGPIVDVNLGEMQWTYRVNELGMVSRVVPDSSLCRGTTRVWKLSHVSSNSPAPVYWAFRSVEKYSDSLESIGGRFGWKPESKGIARIIEFSKWIAESKHTEIRELNLSNGGLQVVLPPQIGLFTNLEKLNISGNQLKFLPPELKTLPRLQELDISNNPIFSVADLAAYPNLKVLYARNTAIVESPDLSHLDKIEM